MILFCLILSLSWSQLCFAADDYNEETDGQTSRKILGSSVVTSISVITNGNEKKPLFSDAIGNPVPKPHIASQIASPINLLNPDRYEFYTFNNEGELIKRLMTLEEIQGIIAGGDTESVQFNPEYNQQFYNSENEVSDIVENVQNVLQKEIEAHKNASQDKIVLDTPDVSETWNMILPTIFGTTSNEPVKLPSYPSTTIRNEAVTVTGYSNVLGNKGQTVTKIKPTEKWSTTIQFSVTDDKETIPTSQETKSTPQETSTVYPSTESKNTTKIITWTTPLMISTKTQPTQSSTTFIPLNDLIKDFVSHTVSNGTTEPPKNYTRIDLPITTLKPISYNSVLNTNIVNKQTQSTLTNEMKTTAETTEKSESSTVKLVKNTPTIEMNTEKRTTEKETNKFTEMTNLSTKKGTIEKVSGSTEKITTEKGNKFTEMSTEKMSIKGTIDKVNGTEITTEKGTIKFTEMSTEKMSSNSEKLTTEKGTTNKITESTTEINTIKIAETENGATNIVTEKMSTIIIPEISAEKLTAEKTTNTITEKSTTEKDTTIKAASTEKLSTEKPTTSLTENSESSTPEKSSTEKGTTIKIALTSTEKLSTEKPTSLTEKTESSTSEKSTTEKSTTEKSTTIIAETSTVKLFTEKPTSLTEKAENSTPEKSTEKITEISSTTNSETATDEEILSQIDDLVLGVLENMNIANDQMDILENNEDETTENFSTTEWVQIYSSDIKNATATTVQNTDNKFTTEQTTQNMPGKTPVLASSSQSTTKLSSTAVPQSTRTTVQPSSTQTEKTTVQTTTQSTTSTTEAPKSTTTPELRTSTQVRTSTQITSQTTSKVPITAQTTSKVPITAQTTQSTVKITPNNTKSTIKITTGAPSTQTEKSTTKNAPKLDISTQKPTQKPETSTQRVSTQTSTAKVQTSTQELQTSTVKINTRPTSTQKIESTTQNMRNTTEKVQISTNLSSTTPKIQSSTQNIQITTNKVQPNNLLNTVPINSTRTAQNSTVKQQSTTQKSTPVETTTTPVPSTKITSTTPSTTIGSTKSTVSSSTILSTTLLPKINLENRFGTIQKLNNTMKNTKKPEHTTVLNKITQIPLKETTNKNISDPYRKAEDSWKLVVTVPPPTNAPNLKIKHKPTENSIDLYQQTYKIDLTMQGNFGVSVLSEDMSVFSKLYNELSLKFWNTLLSDHINSERSIVVSPFGAISELAMIFLGARGGTSEEMNDLLKLDEIVSFNPHLKFKEITESVISRRAGSAIVRELYSDNTKGKILDFYKERVRFFYDGHVEEVDFKNINDVIRRRTNLMVKKQTRGNTQQYLGDTNFTVRGPLVSLNMNIFQADCAKASTKGRDGELYFIVLPSLRQRRLVPIPAAVWRAGFIAGYDPELDATAVSLGNMNQIISTIFVIPGQQGHAAPGDVLLRLEARLLNTTYTPEIWTQLLKSMLPRTNLEIQLPRFLHKSVVNITNTLKKMGLNEMFDPKKSDLRGLTGSVHNLYISDMLQVNEFSVCGETQQMHSETYPNLDGTEYQNEQLRSLRYFEEQHKKFADIPLPLRPRQARLPDVARLRFDRPFLYFVRHNPSGLLLHMGRFNPKLLP